MAKAKFWLARDKGKEADYVICTKRPVLPQHAELWGNDTHDSVLDKTTWHRSRGLRLKPGEGPIRVELEVRCKAVRERKGK